MSLCTSDADKIDEEIPENPDDEDEDEEDVDFNPFLKDALSPEPASSSISSDIEGQDGNFTKPSFEDHTIADPNDGEEEVVMQAEGDEREAKNSLSSEKFRKRKCYDDDDGGDEDSDSAISKRTRAKYSLASFTLDELETFLQETDDEDDFYNVDDEEEYRKFLSAVLLGGDGDGDQSGQENGESNAAEEDDEDNDADFEIELEELLESDVEDDVGNSKERKRPETRQSRRPKALKKKGAGQVNRPLRPILPIFPSGVVACFANVGGRHLSNSESCAEKDGLINGVFSSQQIGQLYCLMHEHVQLLIQVFSLSILDPNRQDIASQLHGLIFEMLHKRNDVVASRSAPYPDGCFNSSYMCPSVQDDVPDSYHPKTGSLWTPTVTGPIVTILDVPTLSLVDRYMEDVQNASQEYRHRFMSFNCDSRPEKEPLFHISYSPSIVEANGENSNNCNPHVANIRSPTSGKTTARKPLATAMVESAKRDSVALVPKDISKLAQRFFPVFNPALFPHKPPCTAVTNRILFTESEDELLALGMMEYNTDWKAIQQRFLPCKSKHQIFVRQKNRCSSKAPENPIKAVRRMKTAPLNADELERIKEGMRIFKSDWMSIWKFIVPHKDPSLLPRQFRIALGTQRSYKQDDSVKEKRRLLQSVRKQKAAELTNCTLASDKEDNHTEGTSGRKSSSRDDHVNNANEMYVHQAFLSDWRPGASSIISRLLPCSNFRQKELPSSTVPAKVIQTREQPSIASTHASYFHSTSFLTHPPFSNPMQQNYHGSASNKFNPQIHLLPYRTSGPRMVKLAPGLPPVNLPSSARVISQSELKSSHCGVSLKISAKGGGSSDAGKQNMVPSLSHAASSSAATNSVKNRTKSTQVTDGDSQSHPEEPTAVRDTHLVEERSTDADLQMHPLLFQPPGDGRLPYFPLACRTGTPSAFTFFSGNQPQLNLSLFHKPHQNNLSVDNSSKSSKSREFSSAACNIDFHPLLQRTDVGDTELVTPCTSTQQKASLGANSGQFHNQFDSVQIKSLVNSSSFDASPKHSITNEKINELDLEIHLSSTSMTIATKGSRAVGTNNQPASAISASHVGNIAETCEISRDQVLSDIETSVVPGNNVSKCNVDVVGDLSQPGIVMEQEELSDSDEDVEENLEFECEEMADSDGEGHSDSDLAAEGREEEIPNHATEKVSNKSKFGDQSCELSSPDHPQGNNSIISKSPPSLKLSLTSIGKDTASRSWLSLDSCAPVGSSTLNDKRQESIIISESPCVKKLSSNRPVRSCKKMTPSTKVLAAEKDVVDMAQQLSLGPLAVSTFRKPRMRASRTNTSLTMESTKNARHDQGDFG